MRLYRNGWDSETVTTFHNVTLNFTGFDAYTITLSGSAEEEGGAVAMTVGGSTNGLDGTYRLYRFDDDGEMEIDDDIVVENRERVVCMRKCRGKHAHPSFADTRKSTSLSSETMEIATNEYSKVVGDCYTAWGLKTTTMTITTNTLPTPSAYGMLLAEYTDSGKEKHYLKVTSTNDDSDDLSAGVVRVIADNSLYGNTLESCPHAPSGWTNKHILPCLR